MVEAENGAAGNLACLQRLEDLRQLVEAAATADQQKIVETSWIPATSDKGGYGK